MDDVAELAGRALDIVDRTLATKSAETEFSDISHVAKCIVAMRDRLVARLRTAGPQDGVRDRLDRVNALLSMTASAEFPLQGVHWERMKKARDILADMAPARGG